MRAIVAGVMTFLFFTGCAHLQGVVVEERTGAPLRSAKLCIGRPGSIAVYETYSVDPSGRFDFYVSPTDETNVFVYDGAGTPEETMRRLERWEFSDHMKLEIPRAAPHAPGIDGGTSIRP